MIEVRKYCVHEMHGGICDVTNEYCNLGACKYEALNTFAPVVKCKNCTHNGFNGGNCTVCIEDGDYRPNFFCGSGERMRGALA